MKEKPLHNREVIKEQETISKALPQLKSHWKNGTCHGTPSNPGTLIVMVGHDAIKLERSIRIFRLTQPKEHHKMVVICNGPREMYKDCLPRTAYPEPFYVENSGWDIAMYAAAVTNFNYENYWFLNDDIARVKDGNWLKDFNDKISEPNVDVVGVQAGSPRNFRTTYFGCSRLFFLVFYVSIHYGVLKKDVRTAYRHSFRARLANRTPGWTGAKDFELYNMCFSHAMDMSVEWLQDHKHFVDNNSLYRSVFLKDPRKRIMLDSWRDGLIGFGDHDISDLWDNQNLTVDHIIECAERV